MSLDEIRKRIAEVEARITAIRDRPPNDPERLELIHEYSQLLKDEALAACGGPELGGMPPPPPLPDKVVLSSAEFIAEVVPPDYLIVGWLQRRFIYSLTAATGDGKTAVALRIALLVSQVSLLVS